MSNLKAEVDCMKATPAAVPDLPDAKRRLILEAERAFGEQGIAAASLRDISEAAGHRNKFAAQYHFGDRNGLIRAVLEYRRPHVDRLRQVFLDARGAAPETASPHLLVLAILEPLLLSEDRHELAAYGRFLYALLHYDVEGSLWQDSASTAPVTHRIYAALRRHAGQLSDESWKMRLRAFGRCCIDFIANRKLLLPGGDPPPPPRMEEVAAMLVAMLTIDAPAAY